MNWGAVGAIPTIWSDLPGPLTAGLGFRVGRADEPLSRGGLTHLVEHLALHGLGERLYNYDGWVNGTTTWFGFRGTPDEAVEFFGHVQGNLLDPPLDRIETELNVIRAEEGRQPMSVAGRSLLYRFGTVGWGTLDLYQYGINSVTPDQVLTWIRQWFGAGNAVLWLSGEPPPALTSSLPDVPHRPEPAAAPLGSRRWPAWVGQGDTMTAVSFLAPRTPETNAWAGILCARARRALRDEAGTTYEITVSTEPLDVNSAQVLVSADGPPGAVVEVLHRVTGQLAAEGPSEKELDHHRALARRKDPAAELAASAHRRLCRWPDPPSDGLGAATPSSMAQLVADAFGTALYLVPHGTHVPASIAAPIGATPDEDLLEGISHRSKGHRREHHHRLIVGPAGVSEVTGDRRVTVRAEQATAVLAWRNGARMLVGPDGTSVKVDPNRWDRVNLAVMDLDEHVPPSAVVPMGDDPGWTDPAPAGRQHPVAASIVVLAALIMCLVTTFLWAA